MFIISIVGILGNSIISPSNAQNTTEINKIQINPSSVNILKIIQDNEPLIEVEYQSDAMVVLKGDEDLLLISNGTLAPFWHAIDIIKKQGYSLEHFTESGAGSQGNPTRIYAILEK
jgi:predicted nucleic acid-binding protein